MDEVEVKLHVCKGNLPWEAYGPAIEDCREVESGALWVGNGEYASQVNFCPYCGYEAKSKVNT